MGHAFEPLSYAVWGACIEVQRQLGPHCMEVDYQRALELALAKRGLEFIREAEIPITFDGIEVTRRRVDFVIWDDVHTLLLETKAAQAIKPEDQEQCLLSGSPALRVKWSDASSMVTCWHASQYL